VAGVKVTHGFALHCDANDEPNNLEVNWQDETGSHRFHLDTLSNAICRPDSSGIEGQPVAGFNTYIGSGMGSYDGASGTTALWIFTDQGEPGKGNDTLVISIMAGSETVLSIDCILEGGNHQAHPK